MNKNKALTLTVFVKITANYGESLGNVASVQKVFRNGKVYAVRTKESLKYAIGAQSGLSDDLQVKVDGAAQKEANKERTAKDIKSLEAGYMTTAKSGTTYTRNSSFYLTDAVSCDPFVIEPRFANNLNLARTSAKQQGINVSEEKNASKCGLMPYQFEYDLSLKKYSITIDLDRVGVDENFATEADVAEKIARVQAIIRAVKNLRLVVKGNLDNAEPLFIIGGIGSSKTHYFDHVTDAPGRKLNIDSKDLVSRLNEDGYSCALLVGDNFVNEKEIQEKLKPKSMNDFFAALDMAVEQYYEGQ